MTMPPPISRIAMVLAACMTIASAQAPRGPRTDAPDHIRRSARDEAWSRRLRISQARRSALWDARIRRELGGVPD
ncbi:hypothetical protein [Mesoterricola silvestris]|uniref:Uncharacterized protein n=1 Tax=Mesoterricola silvestris TaxID=2927979 RepID=A0AA48K968_9BACT|nr:hypothetical protein [Mesoterricola silvestris]BDU72815.1 hypothetical protein METEAL_19890 [Mesoterricola silvestris]